MTSYPKPTPRSDSLPEQECGCVHFDRYVCANMKNQRQSWDAGLSSHFDFGPCDCDCHDDYDEDQDEEDGML